MCECLLLLCNVILLLQLVNTGTVTGDVLTAAIVAHLEKHLAIFNDSLWVPKHHFATHLGEQLKRFGFLISCFVHERKHKLVKRFANCRENTTSIEKGILEDITHEHFRSLKSSLVKPTMKNGTPANKKVRKALLDCGCALAHSTILSSSEMLVNRRKICTGDVVTVTTHAGDVLIAQIYFLTMVDGLGVCGVSFWPIQGDASTNKLLQRWKCLVTDEPVAIAADRIGKSCIWSKAERGQVSHVLIY